MTTSVGRSIDRPKPRPPWPLEILTFRTRAWLSFAPPTCRMPLGQASGFPRADPGGRVTPRFWHRLIRFRHFRSSSLALASLDRACRNLVPAFPQCSPPWLLTAAACGGLRSAPDCSGGDTLHYDHAADAGRFCYRFAEAGLIPPFPLRRRLRLAPIPRRSSGAARRVLTQVGHAGRFARDVCAPRGKRW
jgi:hypothetical protein